MADTSDSAPPSRPIAADPAQKPEERRGVAWWLWFAALAVVACIIGLIYWANLPKEVAATPTTTTTKTTPAAPTGPTILVTIPAPAGAMTAPVYDLGVVGGELIIVPSLGAMGQVIPATIKNEIMAICEATVQTGVLSIDTINYSVAVKDREIWIGGKESGLECPIAPELQIILGTVAKDWDALGRTHGDDAFNPAHKAEVLKAIEKAGWPAMIIKRADLEGYHGEDSEWLNKAFANSTTGQFPGYVVDVDTIRYFIVSDICLDICHGPAVALHLHIGVPKAKAKATKSKPRATKKSPPVPATRPPAAAGIEMLCMRDGKPCK